MLNIMMALTCGMLMLFVGTVFGWIIFGEFEYKIGEYKIGIGKNCEWRYKEYEDRLEVAVKRRF